MQPYMRSTMAAGERRLARSHQVQLLFRSLLDAGATLAFGSGLVRSTAVSDLGIHAAVTRLRTTDSHNPQTWDT